MKSPSFGLSCLSPALCQLKVLSPFIRTVRRLYRRDEPFCVQAVQRLVQRASARVEPTAGLRFHVLSDRVSVDRSTSQRDEDVKRQIGQDWPQPCVVGHVPRWMKSIARRLSGTIVVATTSGPPDL